MKKILILLLLFVASAYALKTPKASKYDSRIVFATYNAQDVFKIFAKNGYVSVLEFGSDERIINTATGFSNGWDLVDKENLLFIKPKAYKSTAGGDFGEVVIDPNGEWKTNLIVTTNLNIYVFDLILAKHQTTYKLSFFYPEKEYARLNKEEQERLEQEEANFIESNLNRTSVPRNWDFYMKVGGGSEDITPNFAYDDGVFTYLGFDNTKTFPSVFAYDNNEESILNTHIKKDGNYDVIVIHKITKQILLRSGSKVIAIYNKGYAKNPLPSRKETSNEAVERVIK